MAAQTKRRVLIIANELSPYLEISDFAEILNKLSVKTFESGMEVRVIMPRFGVINERRHRLHEVVRLSGINIGVDKEDHPLLIKVASLPNARLQVYFMDNEDLFKRKAVFNDEYGQFFGDNDERLIFFCKSALEIVKKFGWPPDIIHCHGWMTSLIPMLLKTAYRKEPVFVHSKTIFSAQKDQFEGPIGDDFAQMVMNSVSVKEKDLAPYREGNNQALTYGAGSFADILIHADEAIGEDLAGLEDSEDRSVISFDEEWLENIDSLFEFYKEPVEV